MHRDERSGGALEVAQLAPTCTRAVRDGRLTRNPADDVRSPHPGITEHRYPNHTEVAMLAKECSEYATLIRFLAYTGLRWGVVAAPHIRRVDLDRRRVQIVEAVTEVDGRLVWGSTKTHAAHRAPAVLPRPGAGAWMQGRRGDDLLFPAPGGGVLRVRNFRRDTFDPAVRRVGPAGFHSHELRHTAASLAIASGADVKVVQQVLGHETATLTLDLPGHLFPDRLAELADRFDDAVCPGSAPEPTDEEEDDQ